MKSKISVAGHPLHTMLVPLPIGLWVFSFVCDVLFHLQGDPIWSVLALYTMGGGVIGASLAAVPGLFDLFFLKSSKAKEIGLWHVTANLSLVTLYLLNLLWRYKAGPLPIGPFVLSIVGVILLAISGWLGGEMVYVHGVGVESAAEPLDIRESHRRKTVFVDRVRERVHAQRWLLHLHHRH